MELLQLKIIGNDDSTIEVRDIITDAMTSRGFELMSCFTGPRGTGLSHRKVDMHIVKRAPTSDVFQGFQSTLSARPSVCDSSEECSQQPAETKDQVAQDAKIKIENLLRRLRVLNVDENFINPKAEPKNELARFAVSLHEAFGKATPSFNTLYQHLSAALREAERLAPVSQLTDDDSGEVD